MNQKYRGATHKIKQKQMSKTFVSQVHRLTPSHSEIVHETEKHYYWKLMLKLWRLPSHILHFPGPNPVSIEKKDSARLGTEDFLVGLKTDGVRNLLMLCTKPNSAEPIAVMIDRTRRIFEIEVWANEDFFEKGSLYDGELVWEQTSLVYIAFDVMMAKGVPCMHLSYRERIQILQNTILSVSEHHEDDSVERMIAEECKFLARNNVHDLRIIPKTCVSKAEIGKLWQERQLCKHRNDGLIFTINSAPIETGTSMTILKWKPNHTIDLLFKLDGTTWNFYANANHSNEHVLLSQTNLSMVLVESKLLCAIQAHLPCVVECVVRLQGEDMLLIPERERTDKTAANTLRTIEATILNVRENLNIQDLMTLVSASDDCHEFPTD